jgi:Tfp pilus assembly protein PilW
MVNPNKRKGFTHALRSKRTGFTTVEVMVTVGIFAFILAAIYGTLIPARRVWLIGEALLGGQQQSRIALHNMARELRLSNLNHVTVAADNRSVRFAIPIDADGDGWMDLNNGYIIYGAENQPDWQIEYQIDNANERIIRRVLDDNAVQQSQTTVAGNIISDVLGGIDPYRTYFSSWGGPTVEINLVTEIDNVGGQPVNPPIQTVLMTPVALRN